MLPRIMRMARVASRRVRGHVGLLQVWISLWHHEVWWKLPSVEAEERVGQACIRRDDVASLVWREVGWVTLARPRTDEWRPPLIAWDVGRTRACIRHAVGTMS